MGRNIWYCNLVLKETLGKVSTLKKTDTLIVPVVKIRSEETGTS